MGKSKSKKSQPKVCIYLQDSRTRLKTVQNERYPTPTDKYLIVTDPWGGVPISEPNFFNNVTAWFEIMFRPKYPGVKPSAIFYQWTNKIIVVEIPDHIDVEPYLGAHYWSTFLVPPHCYNVGTRASFIYEFETRFHPTPVNQGGWTPGYARYTKIRDNFDVKEPYPDPLPAPNSTLPFAKKLPPYKVVAANLPPLLPLIEPPPPKESYNEMSMLPPPLPVPIRPKLSSKMDPYEEDEAAAASLLDPPLKPAPSSPPSKNNRVKQELSISSSSNSQSNSRDVKPRMKAEERDEIDYEGYQPSEDWTKAFASLQQHEEEEQEKPSLSNDYVPSEDLLKALSSLPESMVELCPSSSSSSMVQPKIKAEPRDDNILSSSSSPPPYFSQRNMRERSMTLKDDETSTLSKKNRDFKVKREWSDETYDDPP